MAEWAVIWQAIGVIIATVVGFVGLYKVYQELRRLNEQREKDNRDRQKEIQDRETAAKLKRTEFFLAQHRRLFDDSSLFAVLCLIDDDDPKLAEKDMWDKKRKFLAFLEEIALLVKSDQLNRHVAFYMFGYYTLCVRHGKNFSVGINTDESNWGLFYKFSQAAESYLNSFKDGPPDNISL